jgi:predicted metal-binding protein
MEINFNDLVKDALELKASYAAIADASKIKFHEDYREACKKNICRKYDTNWMGPPAIGPINELMDKVRQYKQGLLIQTAHQLSSSFDYKGMIAAGKVHGEIFRKILDHVKNKYKFEYILPLNAGCCDICERCTYLDGKEKCRFPDKALSSVEAYGIDVMALEKSAGIPYYNGLNTVSYVGLILFNENKN